MLSQRCRFRNEVVIPKLLDDHGAQLQAATDVVDLSTAENQMLMNTIARGIPGAFDLATASSLSYSPGVGGSPGTRQRIVDLLNSEFRPRRKIELDHVVLGAGGSFSLNALVEQICDPGQGILIAAPYWPGLDLSISIHNGAKAIPVHVPLENFFSLGSLEHYEHTLASHPLGSVRGMLICNPHNPLGRNYPRQTLQALLNFCIRHKLHFISDEVYALSQHSSQSACFDTSEADDSCPFVSALELDHGKDGASLVHVLYSLSKDFGCNGLRIGAFISQNNKDICLSGALSTFCETSTMATLVAENAVLRQDNVNYVTGPGRKLLAEAYAVVKQFLLRNNVVFVPAHSGMFVFARLCPEDSNEIEFRFKRLLKKNGVVLAAGSDYHFKRPGWFRVCYAYEREKLEAGLQRIQLCLDELLQDVNQEIDRCYIQVQG